MATIESLSVALEALAKEQRALRKDVRKIRQHLEDPNGEKQAARAQNNGFNKPLGVSDKLRAFLNLRVLHYREGPEEGAKAGRQLASLVARRN